MRTPPLPWEARAIPFIIGTCRRREFVLSGLPRRERIRRPFHDRREALMGRLKSVIPDAITFEDVWDRVGRVPLKRIRLKPPPGYATENDVIRIQDREDTSCELI